MPLQNQVAVRLDGRIAATAGWDGTVRLFDLRKELRPLAELRHHRNGAVHAVAFATRPPAAEATSEVRRHPAAATAVPLILAGFASLAGGRVGWGPGTTGAGGSVWGRDGDRSVAAGERRRVRAPLPQLLNSIGIVVALLPRRARDAREAVSMGGG